MVNMPASSLFSNDIAVEQPGAANNVPVISNQHQNGLIQSTNGLHHQNGGPSSSVPSEFAYQIALELSKMNQGQMDGPQNGQNNSMLGGSNGATMLNMNGHPPGSVPSSMLGSNTLTMTNGSGLSLSNGYPNMSLNGGLNGVLDRNDLSQMMGPDPELNLFLSERKSSQNMTECVAVPSSEHVAEIVGRQGCKIKALRAKTNTYIKTPVRGEDPVFVVTGRKEDVASAKKEILSAAEHFSQIRACRKNNLNGSMAPGPPQNVPGQITIQVRVPYRVVGLVVGPKGATIKRIQQQTHTYIVTPSRDKEPVFEVTGQPDNVDQARREIEAHIAMRTGGINEDEQNSSTCIAAAAAAAASMAMNRAGEFGSHSPMEMYPSASSELVNNINSSSLYKLANNSFNNLGLNGASTGNSLSNTLSNSLSNALANTFSNIGLTNTLSNGFNNSTLSNFGGNDVNSLMQETSLLKNASYDNHHSLFGASLNGPKLGEMNGSNIGNFYNGSADEGLGSLGSASSSIGSSPSLEPNSSSIWRDAGHSLGPSFTSTVNSNALVNNLSTLNNLANRRSSSSTNSPPSRMSPTAAFDTQIRRMNSDPSNSFSSFPNPNGISGRTVASPTESELYNMNGISAALPALNKSGTNSPVNSDRCHICSDAQVVAAFVPCGHNFFCKDCADKRVAEKGQCPKCLVEVTQAIRIITSA